MAKHRATFQGWCPFRGCLHRSESRPTSLERPGSINGWTRPERHRRPSDSSFRAGSRHTRDSCIRGAETAARLTRNALLRWSEIAEARGKTIHREVELHALIDDVNEWDNEHWKAMSPRRQMASAPEALEEIEALRLLSLLRGATSSQDGWCMVWSGYGI